MSAISRAQSVGGGNILGKFLERIRGGGEGGVGIGTSWGHGECKLEIDIGSSIGANLMCYTQTQVQTLSVQALLDTLTA